MERHLFLDQHEDQDPALNYSDFHQFGTPHYPQNTLFHGSFFQTPGIQYFAEEPVNSHEENYLLTNTALSMTEKIDCSRLDMTNGAYHTSNDYYYPHLNGSAGQMQSYSENLADQACPRTYPPLPYEPQIMGEFEMDDGESNFDLRRIGGIDSAGKEEEGPNAIDPFASLSISAGQTVTYHPLPVAGVSPYMAPQFDDSEENLFDEAVSTTEDQTSDEPYAKLIYRALLSAPRRSMVLQEIYQWFIDNTEKGSSTSSGWRNSIRHNLSMNAAFRKSERQSADNDGKKNSEWVLEPFAIKNGVTPTTRYRKSGKKSLKSENPTPSRASAGRKGGISAGKIKSQKLKSKTDRQESARNSIRECRRKRSQARHRLTPTQMDQRQISPPTPLIASVTSSPYYYKPALYEDAFGEPEYKYTLEDVSGVYQEDAPIFCHDGLPRYSDSAPQMWPSY